MHQTSMPVRAVDSKLQAMRVVSTVSDISQDELPIYDETKESALMDEFRDWLDQNEDFQAIDMPKGLTMAEKSALAAMLAAPSNGGPMMSVTPVADALDAISKREIGDFFIESSGHTVSVENSTK